MRSTIRDQEVISVCVKHGKRLNWTDKGEKETGSSDHERDGWDIHMARSRVEITMSEAVVLEREWHVSTQERALTHTTGNHMSRKRVRCGDIVNCGKLKGHIAFVLLYYVVQTSTIMYY